MATKKEKETNEEVTSKKAATGKATTKKKTGKTAGTRKKSASMADKKLVLVESPTKAKTIEKYLGKGFVVKASMGHLRDLPKSQFGIDVDNDFTPKYINIRGKGDIINDLKKSAKNAAKVYLAADPDREGEAIAWHLAYILGVDDKSPCRIVFNEITKPAIQEAVKHPRNINIDMVDAQQARRMLDRIVGYKLSPLLWRKVRKGLSAGRVQSVTVKLICDREKQIQEFNPEEYWTVAMKFRKNKSNLFEAELTYVDGEKISIHNEKDAIWIDEEIKNTRWQVTEVKKKQRSRKPAAPFTTSSLQQDAARKLNFTSRKTMMVAQQLYEGIPLGRKGPVGLITYMRTDSTRISELAQNEAVEYIKAKYGDDYVPEKPNVYNASKKAQDAHEAIRPTNVSLSPEEIEPHLEADQLKLYRLIWQRFLASQMVPALYDTLSVTLENNLPVSNEKRYAEISPLKLKGKASGSRLKFAGFTAVYTSADGNEKDVILPELAEGDELTLHKSTPSQHFTEPPPRYNEASLVKTLEEKGIGRPSTYATTIDTITKRGYVMRSQKQFVPTELGELVIEMMEEYFKDIIDEKFTADMENELDKIAEGEVKKNDLLREFYVPFAETLAKADEAIGHVELPVEVSDVPCDKCGRLMVIKLGRYGKFLACPGFPDCRNTKPILKDTGIKCPKCDGTIVERKGRKRGRSFYGCKNYPDCDFVSWDTPQPEPCKECGALMLKHSTKNGAGIIYCSNDDCESRVDHPINRELEKRKKREEAAAAKAEQKAIEEAMKADLSYMEEKE